ncbi:MAG: PH domain-containing protein [Pseudonocardia sp.]
MSRPSAATREWSPAIGLVVTAWFGAAGAAAWFLLLWHTGADPGGRLLAAVATVGLVVAAAYGTRVRPRLLGDAGGLTVGGLTGRYHYPWPLVLEVRVRQVRRLGRVSDVLEVDTTTAAGLEGLLVFGRLDLAADPRDVAEQLLAIRPPRSVSPDHRGDD